MNDVLLNTVVELLQKLEKKISELKEMISRQPDSSGINAEEKSKLLEATDKLSSLHLPVREMKEQSIKLDLVIHLIKKQAANKVLQHPYMVKAIIVACCLFMLLCLATTAWFNTSEKLDAFKASDTKYRFLKINGNQDLQEILHNTDSLYQVDPGMRDDVIEREKENKQRLEKLQEAMELEQEAKRLREKVRGK